jgi:hypothetical protein
MRIQSAQSKSLDGNQKKTLEDALKDAWKWQKKLGQGNPD